MPGKPVLGTMPNEVAGGAQAVEQPKGRGLGEKRQPSDLADAQERTLAAKAVEDVEGSFH
jgi:hypothetical protein